MGRSKEKSSRIKKPSPPVSKRQKAKDEALKQIAAVREQEPEEDPHGWYGILSYVYDDNNSLEEQVKSLRARTRDLEIYVQNSIRNKEFLKGDFFAWDVVLPPRFPDEFGMVFNRTWGWSQIWGADDQIIASLDGYIVQEDFNGICGRLPPLLQPGFPAHLAEAFLNKTIFDTFFRNPFWYVDESFQREDGNEKSTLDGVSPLGEKLDTLYSSIQIVSNEYSQVWRSVTARLCNSTLFRQTKDFSFGKAVQAHRSAKCLALASHLLANKTFQCLLKPTDEIEKRLGNLGHILQEIAQSAVDMSAQIPLLGFSTLEDLDDQFFGLSSTTEALPFCFAEYDAQGNTQLDGHRVLGIARPYVFRTVNDPQEEKEIELVATAQAFVEEEDSADGGESSKAKQGKKP
ncbi:hypothetical protein BDW59DRAFT_179563 [Aspergillus cavernicola]|uniref:Uncharacterized protein n=1 Tax=Aspergillus cavernicola TaxID=176166 RepID=A0ABR4IFC2_9EURO